MHPIQTQRHPCSLVKTSVCVAFLWGGGQVGDDMGLASSLPLFSECSGSKC